MKTGLVFGAALIALIWLPPASATASVASHPAGLAKALPQGDVEQAHWRSYRHCHRRGVCHGGVYGPGYGVYGPGYGVYGPGYGVYGPGYGVYGPGYGGYGRGPWRW
jgi:hypothetical protein